MTNEVFSVVLVADPALRAVLAEAAERHGPDRFLMAEPEDKSACLLITDRPDVSAGWGAVHVLDLPVRLGAVLDLVRRYRLLREGGAQRTSVRFGPYTLPSDENILSGGAAPIRLTEKECAILGTLHEAGGRTVSRRALLEAVWGYAEGVETHTLETHIYRLRRKIENDPAAPVYLITDEAGYKLANS